jgi:type IV secretory pathway VirB9-like protein
MADTKIIVNCETGEVSEVELTAAEVKQREADAIAYAKAKADEEQAAAEKAEAKAAIADRLGLTQDELALLLA